MADLLELFFVAGPLMSLLNAAVDKGIFVFDVVNE